MNNHPITPPPELFAEWFTNSLKTLDRTVSKDDRGTTGLIAGEVAIQAARWGADQELEACVKWLKEQRWEALAIHLRTARRPKPPSLNEVALQMLGTIERDAHYLPEITDTIRRALEALPE